MKKLKKKLKRPPWKPPPGHKAIQSYVPNEIHSGLMKMKTFHDRSLRAEIRVAVIQVVKKFLEDHKISPDKN